MKGMAVKIPPSGRGYCVATQTHTAPLADPPGSVFVSAQQLWTLEADCQERGSTVWSSVLYCGTSGSVPTVLEEPWERFNHTPVRTHNRIRSPRLAASSL